VPELIIRHIDDVPFQEVKAQMHGDRRAGVHLKIMEWSESPTFIYTRYDPGLTLEVHGHNSNHIIFVLEGSVSISGVDCTPGTMVLLQHGATFGPIIAGPEGTELVEFYTADPMPWSVDKDAYAALLAERGIELLPDPTFEIPPPRPPA